MGVLFFRLNEGCQYPYSKLPAMLFIVIIVLLIGYNLFNVISEENNVFYKDIRFWLVLTSLLILVWLTAQSYPE